MGPGPSGYSASMSMNAGSDPWPESVGLVGQVVPAWFDGCPGRVSVSWHSWLKNASSMRSLTNRATAWLTAC
jgi:hypothetical protein